MIYFCCDERRRDAIAASSQFNGIDFLEVSDEPADPLDVRQRILFVHFIKPLAPNALGESNVQIEGGERIRNIKVARVTIGASSPPASPPQDARVMTVEVSTRGDFSTYTLRLVKDADHPEPPDHFDPILSSIQFSFKVLCKDDFDCKPQRVCPDETPAPIEINYLAKDYASFRQLMFDRMATIAPDWTERNPADLGVTLVELLAYVGDYLSYQQDAVATESYLATARKRSSVRRHARLIDYPLNDGRNSRAWVQIAVKESGDGFTLKQGKGRHTTKLITHAAGLPDEPLLPQDSRAFEQAITNGAHVFELLHEITLFNRHNEMKFYTWGSRECCLPKGATRAALDGGFGDLKPGDVLILKEKRGPETGELQDSDRTHRHAVLLTNVNVTSDPIGGQFKSVPDNTATPVTEIEWGRADALPFPLCISARAGTHFYDDVGVALGNIVLADHGMTFTDIPETPMDLSLVQTSLEPDTVPDANPALTQISAPADSRCSEKEVTQTPARYRPRLKAEPLTHAAPYDPESPPSSAYAALHYSSFDSSQQPLASIALFDPEKPLVWNVSRDLLGSKGSDPDFVAEIENDGTAYLRFGNDQSGLRPASGTKLLATYRIGNGASGNVGAETIKHLVSSDAVWISDLTDNKISWIANPIPAAGGVDPETIEHARQNAPSAFRRQERAVTPQDWEALAVRPDVKQRCDLDIQRAAATVRWTGSWHTTFLTIDRERGADVDAAFEQQLRKCLERYRMAGADLEIDGPRFVSLEIEITVCIKPGYFFSDVRQALLDAFSNRVLADGRKGIFHPDNLTFGQAVYTSSLYAAAQAVTGVDSASITKFQRQGIESAAALNSGKLEIGRIEIARLDNDPNFPERGSLTITQG